MSSLPLVSIITVVYNGEKYLEQTIKSVLNQTYKNLEYIIIDGGSKDGTLDIINKYEAQLAYWVSEPDKGLYDAMNKGIKLAKGELVGLINSDDWYEENAIELIVSAYVNNPDKRIFHGDRYDVLESGEKRIRKFNPSRYKFLYYGMTYNHPSMFVHKDVYAKETYDIKLRALSDYEFVLKNYLTNSAAFFYLPQPYVNYRLDGISANMAFGERIKEGLASRRSAGLDFFRTMFFLAFYSLVNPSHFLLKEVKGYILPKSSDRSK
ncbi:glycosyltransferase family 2 protein [Pontibacter burrus]|uniref:Glycosyltransferase n=1 Tax=Pontibacter burrus TaxID=2704466 RepID=A0A6B3LQA6_9BACT|nr:glycosyltransferase family 2 protein [Pontibacter burrus]NEM97265.1 glycosyltransferase [Pontibacter burrus]